PGQDAGFVCSAIARQIALVEAGRQEPVLMVGNPDPVRDFSDVRDVVRGYAALLERGRAGEVYNLCSGEGVSIAEVIAILRRRAAPRLAFGRSPARAPDPTRARPVALRLDLRVGLLVVPPPAGPLPAGDRRLDRAPARDRRRRAVELPRAERAPPRIGGGSPLLAARPPSRLCGRRGCGGGTALRDASGVLGGGAPGRRTRRSPGGGRGPRHARSPSRRLPARTSRAASPRPGGAP